MKGLSFLLVMLGIVLPLLMSPSSHTLAVWLLYGQEWNSEKNKPSCKKDYLKSVNCTFSSSPNKERTQFIIGLFTYLKNEEDRKHMVQNHN